MQIHPVMPGGLHGQPQSERIIPKDLKLDLVAHFKQSVSTLGMGMTRKALSEGLDGRIRKLFFRLMRCRFKGESQVSDSAPITKR